MKKNYDPIAFGRCVSKQRIAQGLSLREIASALKIATSTVFRIENGAACDVETFLILSKWLNKPIPELPEPCRYCRGSGLERAD